MKAVSGKKRVLFRTVAALLAAGLAVWALSARKDMLVEQAKSTVETALSRGSERTVTIGKIRGYWLGRITLENIEVREPWLSGDDALVLKVKAIHIRYRFLDFFSKKFGSKISVTVVKPEMYWKVRESVRLPEFGFMRWMRQWALAQRHHLELEIQDLSIQTPMMGGRFEGIDVRYADNAFHLELPVAHAKFYGSDVTTVVHVDGVFELGADLLEDTLKGSIRTEGTVINWSPLAEEANFEFVFDEKAFRLERSHFLGGIEVEGKVTFAPDLDVDFSVQARDYALKNLSAFFKIDKSLEIPGRLDMLFHFKGSFWQPQVEGAARLYSGQVGPRTFKALDVNVQGVYPTVRLENSRILMEDGTSMQFANTTIEARDLFRAKTYERLIAGAQQDTVIWGDWELSRPLGLNEQSEFLMQRLLSTNSKVSFKKTNEDEREMQTNDNKQMEVGFEYRLKAEDSLKFNVKDDEEFVGVEHKTTF